jgi:hypothetical protein
MSRGKQKAMTSFQRALLAKENETPSNQEQRAKHNGTDPLVLAPADHVWMDLLLRMVSGDNETFDPFANTTTRALETVTTEDLRGNKLRLCLESTQCVADLKFRVAEQQGASTTERFIIVVNGEQMENSITVADLIAQSNGHPIHCWQRADPVAAPTVETASVDLSVTPPASSTGCSSDLYGSFAVVNAPTGLYDGSPAQPTNAQLMAMMQQMQQQMQQMEGQQQLVMEQHEAEISSLRTSMARVAENPAKIHTTLQKLVRGFLGRRRCKRLMRHAAVQCQRISRGGLVRCELSMKSTMATRIESVWRSRCTRRHAAVQCQRISRGGLVRRELSMKSTMATRIESVWRSRSQSRAHAHTLKSMLSLQRIIRGWLGRQQLACEQYAAIRIAAAFRCHTARMPEVHGRLHRENMQLEASKAQLEAQLALVTSELEQRSTQKEHYQQKHNELLSTINDSILSCPITRQRMTDPVLCTADGYRYERAAITEWINSKGTSPMTRTAITLGNLIPDCPKAISDWHAGADKRAKDAESTAVKAKAEAKQLASAYRKAQIESALAKSAEKMERGAAAERFNRMAINFREVQHASALVQAEHGGIARRSREALAKAAADHEVLRTVANPTTFVLRGFAAKRAANEDVWSEEMQFLDEPNPRHRYSFKLRVYANGNGDADRRKVGVHFAPLPGPDSSALEWPITRKIRLTIINVNDPTAHKQHTIDPIDDANTKASFKRHLPPKSTRKHWGWSSFLSAEQVCSGDFVRDDAMFVACELLSDSTGNPFTRLKDPHAKRMNRWATEQQVVEDDPDLHCK